MKSKLKSWPDFHHRINMVYHALIAVSLVPFALVFLDIDSGKVTTSQIEGSGLILILILLATVSTICYPVWRGVKKRLETIDSAWGIKKKLIVYFNFQIKRYLQLEAGALISMVGLWLTTNYVFVVSYLLILVQFSLLRPSQDKVIRDLKFSKEEREKLRGDEL
ncbi:MAG: hypothetical protein ABJP45_12380 [Cyclobacteriaceae bacterium]